MTIKQELYNTCQLFLDQRLEVIQNTILDLQQALQSETKSSAGDKHETGRAMLQLEREKAGHQLAEIQKEKEILHKVKLDIQQKKIALGSLVLTTKANYFIAISAGELVFNNTTYYAISVGTPIAKLLLSKEVGDHIEFRANQFRILKIV